MNNTNLIIKNGFLVTEMLGMSFNPVNGDYSRGAAGFKIDKGEIDIEYFKYEF